MQSHACPICGKQIPPKPHPSSPVMPFCSERCRDVDLARWFSESYPVPIESTRVLEEVADTIDADDVS